MTGSRLAKSEAEKCIDWLSDWRMLPAILPNARIMRYGYDSLGWGENGHKQRAATVAEKLLQDLRLKRPEQVRRSHQHLYMHFIFKLIRQSSLPIARLSSWRMASAA
jgi:hypothetical protein